MPTYRFKDHSTGEVWEELYGFDKPQPWSSDMKSITLTPNSTGTDGFYFAVMERRSAWMTSGPSSQTISPIRVIWSAISPMCCWLSLWWCDFGRMGRRKVISSKCLLTIKSFNSLSGIYWKWTPLSRIRFPVKFPVWKNHRKKRFPVRFQCVFCSVLCLSNTCFQRRPQRSQHAATHWCHRSILIAGVWAQYCLSGVLVHFQEWI